VKRWFNSPPFHDKLKDRSSQIINYWSVGVLELWSDGF